MTAVLPEVGPSQEPGALTGPPTLRILPIPDTEPPPDCGPFVDAPANRADRADRGRPPGPRQPTLALALVTTPEEPSGLPFERFGRRPTATSDLPDPEAWARRMVQAVLEALSGIRPVAQLVRWTSLDVYAGLQRRSALAAGRPLPGRRAVVRSVRVGQPADGVVEACAVVVARGRVQAVALRLEGLDGRWRMTALELG
jgi:hypothetical protein